MSEHVKDFPGWHNLKVVLNGLKAHPTFKEREIWWCSIGINVGYEIDGKTAGKFNRPVLIVRKFNNKVFWGVPLTTKDKCGPFHVPVNFKGNEQCVTINQLRLWDSRRLTHKAGDLTDPQFQKIKQALKDLL